MKYFFTSLYILLVDAMILSLNITGIQFLVEKTGNEGLWALIIFVAITIVLNTGYLVEYLINKE